MNKHVATEINKLKARVSREAIVVGGVPFALKKHLTAWAKDHLKLGIVPHHDAMLDFLARHPDAATKIGPGVERFEIAPDGMGSKCFWAVRADGTRVAFSYRPCVSGRPFTVGADFAGACRAAVKDYTDAFRCTWDHGCAECRGELVQPEVDHVDMDFSRIVELFRETLPADLVGAYATDERVGTHFERELAYRFLVFHEHYVTHLEVVCRRCHQTRTRRRREEARGEQN